MRLLYLHGSTLDNYLRMDKISFLDALNPGGFFSAVHMVDFSQAGTKDVEREQGVFRFTSVGLARDGAGRLAKWRVFRDVVRALATGPRPALVLADDVNLLGLAARWIARRLGVPYGVCIYYDNDLHYRLTGRPVLGFLRSRRLELALECLVLRGAAGVYAGTRGYLEYGIRHGARRERACPGVFSVDDIFYREPVAPHPDSRDVLMVSRLHPLKFIEDVLHAIAALPPSVRFDVAGEGAHRPQLEALVASLGLGSRVRLLGMIPRADVLARMQGARVLVVTQGMSAAIEAVLSGRPVVTYDHECNAEVVRDGDTGLVVPFRDVKALGEAIRRLLDDPALAQELGRRGRQSMLAEWSIPASLERRRQFFELCLRGR